MITALWGQVPMFQALFLPLVTVLYTNFHNKLTLLLAHSVAEESETQRD